MKCEKCGKYWKGFEKGHNDPDNFKIGLLIFKIEAGSLYLNLCVSCYLDYLNQKEAKRSE